jgi:proliferating cell nuclear antigen
MGDAFVAKLDVGDMWSKIVAATKDLLNEVKFDVNNLGIDLQAMDTSHVALIKLFLAKGEFQQWLLARNQSLGVNLSSMAKILSCAGKGNAVKLSCLDNGDLVTFEFVDPVRRGNTRGASATRFPLSPHNHLHICYL